jgi:lactate dehydrogenase-like 2-hydroxyacid dehydrogenase
VTDPITADVLSAEPLRAKFIGNFGVGYDNIDIDAAKARGITVTNTPEVLTDCTADLAMTLLLSAARRVGEGERHVRSKSWTGWRPTHMIGAKVTGQTLGLIGMGRIACAVAERAHFGFGMNILFSDPYPPPPEVTARLNAKECTTEEVLRDSDFVSLHCPGGDETYHLIDTAELKLMKPGAILVNSARGEVVNNEALISALRDGEIAAAGLDVFEGEPHINDGFLSLENVVLLPHLGSATRLTRVAMGNRVLENLQAYFAGKTPRDNLV